MEAHATRPACCGIAAPPPWSYAVLLPAPLLAWYFVVSRELALAPGGPTGGAASALAWAGVAALLAGVLVEVAFYAAIWSARGCRFAFAPCALILLQLSLLEAIATTVLQHPPGSDPWLGLACVLVGPRLTWEGHAPTGFASAFGSLGVLALARMALWAWAQSASLGRRWREAATIVALVWLGSHVTLGWLLELIRGRSATP